MRVTKALASLCKARACVSISCSFDALSIKLTYAGLNIIYRVMFIVSVSSQEIGGGFCPINTNKMVCFSRWNVLHRTRIKFMMQSLNCCENGM